MSQVSIDISAWVSEDTFKEKKFKEIISYDTWQPSHIANTLVNYAKVYFSKIDYHVLPISNQASASKKVYVYSNTCFDICKYYWHYSHSPEKNCIQFQVMRNIPGFVFLSSLISSISCVVFYLINLSKNLWDLHCVAAFQIYTPIIKVLQTYISQSLGVYFLLLICWHCILPLLSRKPLVTKFCFFFLLEFNPQKGWRTEFILNI